MFDSVSILPFASVSQKMKCESISSGSTPQWAQPPSRILPRPLSRKGFRSCRQSVAVMNSDSHARALTSKLSLAQYLKPKEA